METKAVKKKKEKEKENMEKVCLGPFSTQDCLKQLSALLINRAEKRVSCVKHLVIAWETN